MLLFPCISLKINFVLANSTDPDEMLHFIWVFTVCKSPDSGVSSLKRVKVAWVQAQTKGDNEKQRL